MIDPASTLAWLKERLSIQPHSAQEKKLNERFEQWRVVEWLIHSVQEAHVKIPFTHNVTTQTTNIYHNVYDRTSPLTWNEQEKFDTYLTYKSDSDGRIYDRTWARREIQKTEKIGTEDEYHPPWTAPVFGGRTAVALTDELRTQLFPYKYLHVLTTEAPAIQSGEANNTKFIKVQVGFVAKSDRWVVSRLCYAYYSKTLDKHEVADQPTKTISQTSYSYSYPLPTGHQTFPPVEASSPELKFLTALLTMTCEPFKFQKVHQAAYYTAQTVDIIVDHSVESKETQSPSETIEEKNPQNAIQMHSLSGEIRARLIERACKARDLKDYVEKLIEEISLSTGGKEADVNTYMQQDNLARWVDMPPPTSLIPSNVPEVKFLEAPDSELPPLSGTPTDMRKAVTKAVSVYTEATQPDATWADAKETDQTPPARSTDDPEIPADFDDRFQFNIPETDQTAQAVTSLSSLVKALHNNSALQERICQFDGFCYWQLTGKIPPEGLSLKFPAQKFLRDEIEGLNPPFQTFEWLKAYLKTPTPDDVSLMTWRFIQWGVALFVVQGIADRIDPPIRFRPSLFSKRSQSSETIKAEQKSEDPQTSARRPYPAGPISIEYLHGLSRDEYPELALLEMIWEITKNADEYLREDAPGKHYSKSGVMREIVLTYAMHPTTLSLKELATRINEDLASARTQSAYYSEHSLGLWADMTRKDSLGLRAVPVRFRTIEKEDGTTLSLPPVPTQETKETDSRRELMAAITLYNKNPSSQLASSPSLGLSINLSCYGMRTRAASSTAIATSGGASGGAYGTVAGPAAGGPEEPDNT